MLNRVASQLNSQRALIIFSGVILIFAAAQITIPIYPVPITLQTLAVLLIALTYSMQDGLSAVMIYLVAGSLGVPIFSNMSSGIGGATTGYMLGFIACIYAINKFKERFNIDSLLKIVLACIIGNSLIFVCGIAWLSNLIGLKNSIIHGLIPFIIPGIVKSALLGLLLKTIKFRVK